ncbi:hypothetical protein [Massilia sp. HP4]|uniref:hypothetical protein n=1 Tax=Massilia sp. HP4 TaxID=2562316 RepID=UPI0010C00F83|nr:hypothetical protein [Massilia sp. HP4]
MRFKRLYDDDGFSQVEIAVEDERASIAVQAYVNLPMLEAIALALENFTEIVPGAAFDIALGSTGEHIAGGGVDIAFSVTRQRAIVMTVLARSQYGDIGARQFGEAGLTRGAMELRTFLVTEPALLDRFAMQLRGFCSGFQDRCELEAEGGWLA